MTDVAHGEKPLPLLPGAHRVIRALDASDGPFVGLLVTRGDGVAVQLDEAELAGWVGWEFAGAEHVAGPVDVIRRPEGHDVLVPWCTERIASLLARRHIADEALSPGECSTLVASMLRGIDELGGGALRERGAWWITGEGRPVFAFGEGDGACSGASRVLELLEEGCRDKAMGRLLASVQVGLRAAEMRPRIPRRQIEQWESELFELAAPRPLRCDVHAPERTRDVARAVSSQESVIPSRSRARGRRTPKSDVGLWSAPVVSRILGATRAVRLALASLQNRPTLGAQRADDRPRHPRVTTAAPRSRRRSLAIAGAAAAVVLAGGLLWPSGDSGEASEGAGTGAAPHAKSVENMPTSEPTELSATESVVPGSDTNGSDTADSSLEDASAEDGSLGADSTEGEKDPLVAVFALLAKVRTCTESGDRECAEAISSGSSDVLTTLAEIAETRPTFHLVDEYGDVAVVRVDRGTAALDAPSTDGPSESTGHILVLVRAHEKWLVRDVHDVADQPE
ncbi:hypothetical protein [Microbacterium sp. NPDC087665]|uniref:hypothetical protein n=1 Tax=Microbacterium sp. NPDC087665 TaxID=3364194 RepID=UPI0038061BD5